jgi:hypothetical protein
MSASASIAQEFYKIREEWDRADKLKTWQLAIWVAQFQDIDIIDRFMETERLPIGIFDDFFFRFETEYSGDTTAFEKALWEEYASWFQTPPQEKFDMVQALKNDELLHPEFAPLLDPGSGFENLMQELLRLKAHIKGMEKAHCCLYFPPTRPETYLLGRWLRAKLVKGIPQGIRLATIDFAADRKININTELLQPLIIELEPQLNMLDAIKNEMDKGGGASDTVSIDQRFRKQIRVVMETTTRNDKELTAKEVMTLLSYGKQMGNTSSLISALLIASQAHYSIKDNEQSEIYADKAIKQSEAAMSNNDPAGYPTWKTCMMLKGALLSAKRKWEAAIELYDRLAAEATNRQDIFFIMEGHRISGHLYYVRGRMQPAFEKLLLAMVAGSYLDKKVIRESTFLHAAHLALYIGKSIKDKNEIDILESQLEDWIGEDWRALLNEGELEKTTIKVKRKFPLSLS